VLLLPVKRLLSSPRAAFGLCAIAAGLALPALADTRINHGPWSDEAINFDASTSLPGAEDAFVAEVVTKLSAFPRNRNATFAVRSADPDSKAGLDFDSFSKVVAEQLEKSGLTPSDKPEFTAWVNCVTYDGQTSDPKLHKDVFTVVIIRSSLTEGSPGRIVYKAAAVGIVPDMEGELPKVMPPMIKALFKGFPESPGERVVKCAWE